MIAPSTLRRRLRALLRRSEVESEMHDELALHFELHVRNLEANGFTSVEARRRATIDFAGMEHVKESYRDARGVRPLEKLMQDIKYATRTLLRQRLFAAAVVLTFAIGIGATTAIFSLVDAAWFSWGRSFTDADRLAMIYKTFPNGRGAVSPVDFRDWQAQSHSFSSIAGYIRGGSTLVSGGEPIRRNTVSVSPNYFSVVGVRPLLGRFFRDDEGEWGRHRVVVLSYATWQRDFAGDPSIVGRKVTLDNAAAAIIGVAPSGSWFGPRGPEIYIPIAFAPADPINARHSHFVFVLGHLAPGQTLASANAELKVITKRIATLNPENEGTSAEAVALEEIVLGEVKPTLRMLLGAALLVLLIACANVTNLLLVRTTARIRELAVRSALGASARRIAQQLLTESVVLATIGGAVGVAIAVLIVNKVGGTLPIDLPRIADTGIPIDWRVLALSLMVVLGTGAVCGMLPVFHLIGGERGTDALRQGSRSVSGGKGSALIRSGLVSAQVALALVLLVTSGLLTRSLLRLQQQDNGANPTGVMSMRLGLPADNRTNREGTIRFYDEVVRRVQALPGVTAAGVSSHLPLSGGGETKSFWVEGRPPKSLPELQKVVGRMESANSLQTLGVSLLRGRWFNEGDHEKATHVAIIGESVARRFFKDQDPLGKRISLFPPENLSEPSRLPPGGLWPRFTVIGIVKDVRYGDARADKEDAVYVHYPQGRRIWPWGPEWLVVKTSLPPVSAANAIRETMRSIDATLPVGAVMPLTDRMAQALRAPRFTAALIATFALVAVLLGVIGLYGVIAYSVAQETRAIGVRLALGATPGEIARLVVRRGAVLAVIGIFVGFAAAYGATRWVASQLFGVSPLDPVTYAAAGAVLFGLAVLASWIPARRAAATDALVALRSDG